ncbi:hypothetical protein BU15DRAFT_66969 [Melanogaster broomeanus]|nr:hypothetical protein BU15DRAFT_66969 [Melanogaster broomeanus]
MSRLTKEASSLTHQRNTWRASVWSRFLKVSDVLTLESGDCERDLGFFFLGRHPMCCIRERQLRKLTYPPWTIVLARHPMLWRRERDCENERLEFFVDMRGIAISLLILTVSPDLPPVPQIYPPNAPPTTTVAPPQDDDAAIALCESSRWPKVTCGAYEKLRSLYAIARGIT